MRSMLPSLLMSQGTNEGVSATSNGVAVETFVHLWVEGMNCAMYEMRLCVASVVAEF